MAHIQSLRERIASACRTFICTLTSESPVYKPVKSRIPDVQTNYSLTPRNLTVRAAATNRFGDASQTILILTPIKVRTVVALDFS